MRKVRKEGGVHPTYEEFGRCRPNLSRQPRQLNAGADETPFEGFLRGIPSPVSQGQIPPFLLPGRVECTSDGDGRPREVAARPRLDVLFGGKVAKERTEGDGKWYHAGRSEGDPSFVDVEGVKPLAYAIQVFLVVVRGGGEEVGEEYLQLICVNIKCPSRGIWTAYGIEKSPLATQGDGRLARPDTEDGVLAREAHRQRPGVLKRVQLREIFHSLRRSVWSAPTRPIPSENNGKTHVELIGLPEGIERSASLHLQLRIQHPPTRRVPDFVLRPFRLRCA